MDEKSYAEMSKSLDKSLKDAKPTRRAQPECGAGGAGVVETGYTGKFTHGDTDGWGDVVSNVGGVPACSEPGYLGVPADRMTGYIGSVGGGGAGSPPADGHQVGVGCGAQDGCLVGEGESQCEPTDQGTSHPAFNDLKRRGVRETALSLVRRRIARLQELQLAYRQLESKLTTTNEGVPAVPGQLDELLWEALMSDRCRRISF